MPLLKRKPVAMLPLPPQIANNTLPEDAEVFVLKATGEVFLDFKSYSDRMSFYLQKIFVCEYSGRSNLDYFEGLDSEWNESKKTQEKFPDPLKPRVLRACQFQVEGRLENLADLAFERFQNRYFLNEKVIVNNASKASKNAVAQYYGLIVKVIPPDNVRALIEVKPGSDSDAEELADDPVALDLAAHSIGTKIEVDKEIADKEDNPAEYIYVVRLMDKNTFTGPEYQIRASALQRDRQTFSKNLLKRFLKESMCRDPAVGAPWMVKPRLSSMYDIPTDLPDIMKQKSEVARVELLTKRKGQKGKREGDGSGADTPVRKPKEPKVRRPKAEKGDAPAGTSRRRAKAAVGEDGAETGKKRRARRAEGEKPPKKQRRAAAPAVPVVREPPKPKPKYPIDDLELDPTTILDGRIRRSIHQELPPLPVKPLPRFDLPVPQEHFTRFLQCWNILNIFGQVLMISPFTLDDFKNALFHQQLTPRCVLLGEIHSVLTNNIAAESSRLPVTGLPTIDTLPVLAADILDYDDGMDTQEREKWVTKAFEYSRGWDRKARPKAADGRKGWESHLCGILTQRGGIETVPSLPKIFKHMFSNPIPGAELEHPADVHEQQEEAVQSQEGTPASRSASNDETGDTPTSTVGEATEAKPAVTGAKRKVSLRRTEWTAKDKQNSYVDPEENYLSLSLDEKLDVLEFLCEANLMTKAVKTYMEDCELRLTEERKEKAEINKEKKELLMERAALLNPDGVNKGKGGAAAAGSSNGTPGPKLNGAAGDGTASATATPALTPAPKGDESMSISIAPSDRADSAMPDDDEPYSRQPSSSPLPDLDKEEMDENDDVGVDDEGEDDEKMEERKPVLSRRTSARNAKKEEDLDEENGEEVESKAVSPAGVDEGDEEENEEGDQEEEDEDEKDEMEEDEQEEEEQEEGQEEEQDGDDEEEDLEEADQINVDEDDDADNEVGSEVDELQSSGDEDAKEPSPPPQPARMTKRVPTKPAPTASRAKKSGKGGDRKAEIEEELEMNAKKDDLHDRDWRRHREVARIRPMGLDRFFQRYWWFDGIGPQSLLAPNGRIVYGTGRLFIQGPSEIDWQKAIDDNGGTDADLDERRKKEEGQERLLGIDEWAYYEDEKDIEQLLAWLNAKGIREHACKANLTKWKHYIIEGAKSRQSDLLHGFEAAAAAAAAAGGASGSGGDLANGHTPATATNGSTSGTRRTTRGGARGRQSFVDEPAMHYLAYQNTLAQK